MYVYTYIVQLAADPTLENWMTTWSMEMIPKYCLDPCSPSCTCYTSRFVAPGPNHTAIRDRTGSFWICFDPLVC